MCHNHKSFVYVVSKIYRKDMSVGSGLGVDQTEDCNNSYISNVLELLLQKCR